MMPELVTDGPWSVGVCLWQRVDVDTLYFGEALLKKHGQGDKQSACSQKTEQGLNVANDNSSLGRTALTGTRVEESLPRTVVAPAQLWPPSACGITDPD